MEKIKRKNIKVQQLEDFYNNTIQQQPWRDASNDPIIQDSSQPSSIFMDNKAVCVMYLDEEQTVWGVVLYQNGQYLLHEASNTPIIAVNTAETINEVREFYMLATDPQPNNLKVEQNILKQMIDACENNEPIYWHGFQLEGDRDLKVAFSEQANRISYLVDILKK